MAIDMTNNRLWNFIKKPGTILFVISVIALIFSLGWLSHVGFEISVYFRNNEWLSHAIAVVFSFIGLLNIYRLFVMNDDVTASIAVKIYLSLGFAMGGVYYLVHVSHDGCFGLPTDIEECASIIDFTYFSFVTVTTIGYGDIVPRHTLIRFLVLIHVLFTMYLILRVTTGKEGRPDEHA